VEAARQFGRNVRRERERRGMTQEDLAHAADVHPTQVSHIEAGKRSPRFMTIVKLASALGVKPGRLFDRIG
jgi:transcriptional regulator with XRE-family HTH domain